MRYRVDRGAHSRLRELVGDDLSSRPRALFIIAKVIDELFDELAEDMVHLPADMLKRATARPPNFLQDVVNRPPPIGQMTPIAICRAAFQRFSLCRRNRAVAGGGLAVAPGDELAAREGDDLHAGDAVGAAVAVVLEVHGPVGDEGEASAVRGEGGAP